MCVSYSWNISFFLAEFLIFSIHFCLSVSWLCNMKKYNSLGVILLSQILLQIDGCFFVQMCHIYSFYFFCYVSIAIGSIWFLWNNAIFSASIQERRLIYKKIPHIDVYLVSVGMVFRLQKTCGFYLRRFRDFLMIFYFLNICYNLSVCTSKIFSSWFLRASLVMDVFVLKNR